MNDIKVSIIVPVYNIPDDILRKCIESAINQTMKEIEIILVDDGSTNNSSFICDEYSIHDKRIKVIHKENSGLAAARNTGYENANGEWVTFLDSDDWIDSKTCEDNYKLGCSTDSDVVIFGTVQEFEHYKKCFKYKYDNGTIFENEKCKDLQCEILNFNGNIATAWGKLFRKKFLDKYHLKHNAELRQGSEGIEFNIRVFEKVSKTYFTNQIYYHYIYNPNSISAKHDEKNHFYVIDCFKEIKKQIEVSQNRYALEKMFYNRFAYVIVATAISGYFSPANKQKFSKKKKRFKVYCEDELVKTTLNKYDTKEIDNIRLIILFCIKHHIFLVINILSYIRYKQKHI